MDVRDLLNLPDILNSRKVVCVQPHPDDNEVGMGGTVGELVHRNCEIVFITVTDGRSGAPEPFMTPEQVVDIRTEERNTAGSILGVHKHIALNFPDAGPYNREEVFKQLVPILRTERPNVVFTVDPWTPYETHPDHVKTGLAVAEAVLFAGNRALFPETEPVSIPQIAFYASAYPNTYVDVSQWWDRKLAAITAHKSQFNNPEGELVKSYLSFEAAKIYAKCAEQSGQEGFAESFKVLATQQLHFFPNAIFS